MLVTHEADNPIDIATPRLQVVVITHVGLDVNLSDPIEVRAECIPNLRRHLLYRAVTLHERQRLLRPDALDAWMKVGPHEQAKID